MFYWAAPTDSALASDIDGFEHTMPFPHPRTTGVSVSWSRDSASVDSLLNALTRSHISLTSTLVLFDRFANGAPPVGEPTFEAMPTKLRQRSESLMASLMPAAAEKRAIRLKLLRRFYTYLCAEFRLFNAKGGTILAGTDSYVLFSFPGDLQRELELLVECGLSPDRALAAATRAPAAWLRADSVGTVEAGKVADLLLLDADPRVDIRNTRRIELVMQAGHVWCPADLLAMADR